MKIGVIGLGDVGLSFSLLCERNGFKVIGSDIRKDHIENLNLKIINTKNPSLQRNLIESTQIIFTNSNVEVIENSDFIFVFVDTTIDSNENYNTNRVFEVVSCFFDANKEDINLYDKKLIIGSTTNPGDVDQIQKKLSVFNIQVAYNPILKNFDTINPNSKEPEFVLIGTEYESLSMDIRYILSSVLRKSLNVQITPIKTAEITKLFLSSYTLMHQTFLNFIGDILISNGDKDNINLVFKSIESFFKSKQLIYQYNNENQINYLTSDNLNLNKFITEIGHPYNLISDIINSNNSHLEYLKLFLLKENPNKTIPFVFINSVGDTHDTQSIKFKLCLDLLNEGYNVHIVDGNQNIDDFKSLISEFNHKLKIFKSGSKPEGYMVKLT
jgi:UDP-glucose 6-dehydrogenase